MIRRGRRRATTALLLIDFINPLDFPEAERLRQGALRAAERTAVLKAAARKARLPCIYVNDHFGHWALPFERIVEMVAETNPVAAALVDRLRPEPGEVSIVKPRHSGFYGTPLEFLLEELGVKRLILTGLATDNCVFATAQDAFVRKFEVWIPADCVAAKRGSEEPAVLRHMERTLKAKTSPFRGKLWPAS